MPTVPNLKPGSNQCFCRACKQHFFSPSAFEVHRAGVGQDRACLPGSQVSDSNNRRRLRMNARGFWVLVTYPTAKRVREAA